MFKFEKEDLREVLPTNVLETKALTTKQKIVLGQLVMLNGLEQTKSNGYFFRSNKDLASDCGITEMTLLSALKKIEALGFIERKQGKRGVGASEYKVNESMLNDYYKNEIIVNDNTINYSKHENYSNDKIIVNDRENYSKDVYYKNENYSNNGDTEKECNDMKTNELLKTIEELKNKIIVLENTINYSKHENYSNDYYKNENVYYKNENYSTDTDTDSDLYDTVSNTLSLNKKEKEKNNLYTVSVLNTKKEKELTDLDAASEAQGEASEIEVFENKSFGVPSNRGEGNTSEREEKNMTPTTPNTIEQRSVTKTVTIPTEVGVTDTEADTTTPTEEENTTPTEADTTTPTEEENSTPTEEETTPTEQNAFLSPLTRSNAPSGTTAHQHGENATEAQEMPSNGITVRYAWGVMEFEDEEQHRFFDQVGVLLKRLEAEDDDTQFRVKLGKFRNWLIGKGMSKETFDNNFLQRITRIREDRKKEDRLLSQRRALWGRRRV